MLAVFQITTARGSFLVVTDDTYHPARLTQAFAEAVPAGDRIRQVEEVVAFGSPVALRLERSALEEHPSAPAVAPRAGVPAWAQVLEAARHDPFLYRAVTLVERGDLSREEALIQAALHLSELVKQQTADAVEALRRAPGRAL